jgi:hypothetical protein
MNRQNEDLMNSVLVSIAAGFYIVVESDREDTGTPIAQNSLSIALPRLPRNCMSSVFHDQHGVLVDYRQYSII